MKFASERRKWNKFIWTGVAGVYDLDTYELEILTAQIIYLNQAYWAHFEPFRSKSQVEIGRFDQNSKLYTL